MRSASSKFAIASGVCPAAAARDPSSTAFSARCHLSTSSAAPVWTFSIAASKCATALPPVGLRQRCAVSKQLSAEFLEIRRRGIYFQRVNKRTALIRQGFERLQPPAAILDPLARLDLENRVSGS